VNFPEILGDLSAAALSNAYFPANERGPNLVLINDLAILEAIWRATLSASSC